MWPERGLDRVGIDGMLPCREERDELRLTFSEGTRRANDLNIAEYAHFNFDRRLRISPLAVVFDVRVAVGLFIGRYQGLLAVHERLVEELLGRLVETAGFANVRMEDVPVHNDYPSVDEYVRRSSEMGGMFSRAWAEAPEEEQERMKDEFREAFAPFAVDGGYKLPGVSLCVVAS